MSQESALPLGTGCNGGPAEGMAGGRSFRCWWTCSAEDGLKLAQRAPRFERLEG
jgi:hypothetical protein